MPDGSVRRGSFYWLHHEGKTRPCVVIDVRDDRAVVIVGTTKQRPRIRVQLRASGRTARALGLTKDTYFYPDNLFAVRTDALLQEGKMCPVDLFLDLRTLIQEFDDRGASKS